MMYTELVVGVRSMVSSASVVDLAHPRLARAQVLVVLERHQFYDTTLLRSENSSKKNYTLEGYITNR
jgi:hypothetical protein